MEGNNQRELGVLRIDLTKLTSKLPKDHLLPRLDRFRLDEQRRGGPRVQVGKEAPNTRLSPSGQLRAEFDPFLDGLKVVSVFALLGALSLEDVRDEGRVTDWQVEVKVSSE